MDPIQKYIAWQLCNEIWKENRGKWYTRKGFQCWNCSRSGPESPANRCVSNQPDYRGCPLVNERYASRFGSVKSA